MAPCTASWEAVVLEPLAVVRQWPVVTIVNLRVTSCLNEKLISRPTNWRRPCVDWWWPSRNPWILPPFLTPCFHKTPWSWKGHSQPGLFRETHHEQEFTKSNFLKNKKLYPELHFGIVVGVMLTWSHCNSASIQVKQVHIVDIQHSNMSCYKSCPCMSTNRHFSAIWVIHACPFFYSNNICARQPATHRTSRSSVIPTKSSWINTNLDPFLLDEPANYRKPVTVLYMWLNISTAPLNWDSKKPPRRWASVSSRAAWLFPSFAAPVVQVGYPRISRIPSDFQYLSCWL